MDLSNLWLWSGLRIGPQLMDGLSAGRSPPRSKEEEEEVQDTENARFSVLTNLIINEVY